MGFLESWSRKSKQATIVLHGVYVERARQLKSGKVKRRVTVQTDATPILHFFDEELLGAGPAEAMAEIYRDAVKGIAGFVSGATRDRRERHRKSTGTRSYQRRYMGGRTGHTPPQPNSVRWGTDSGRLADGIAVRHVPSQKSFITNVPANRLNRETFGRGFDAFLAELAKRAPVLGNAAKLAKHPKMVKAIEKSRERFMVKLDTASATKLRAVRMARIRLARQIVGGFASLAA
ncbi:MAG: hypothetical protein R3258_10590 [Acidimicrobiia bacterium]|nr:hypothetical protein [Acidimicrobiia bacterium]